MAVTQVALILGSGPRVGAAVSARFASLGYKVAIVSRKGSESVNGDGYLSLKADFSNSDSIPPVFETVKNTLGAYPAVIVYNCSGLAYPPDKDSILSNTAQAVTTDLMINVVSSYVAAQQALKGWRTLPDDVVKTFIYTGNILNTKIFPQHKFLDLGMGKAASSYWVGTADIFYTPHGYRFFYTDERHPDGTTKDAALDGEAHADFYTQLIRHEGNVPWHATFVKGKGYVDFSSQVKF